MPSPLKVLKNPPEQLKRWYVYSLTDHLLGVFQAKDINQANRIATLKFGYLWSRIEEGDDERLPYSPVDID